jgi:hypothetical protein
MTIDPYYDRATFIVQRRLHRIVRMHMAGKLSAEQATECTHAAENPAYYEKVVRVLKLNPSETYGMCLVGAMQGHGRQG